MDLDVLKHQTLELIEQYNKSACHRTLEPISGYGDQLGKIRLYWALWSDDIQSTHQVGFMYNGEKLSSAVGLKNFTSLEAALDNFEQQLGAIPLKKFK